MKALRIIIIIIAIAFLIAGILGLAKYAKDYNVLSNYGQGYVIGKSVLTIAGALLLFVSFRLSKKSNTSTQNY